MQEANLDASKAGQRGHREMSHRDNGAGRLHHVIQNGVKLESYESVISGIRHLMFSGCDKPRIIETAETQSTDTGVLL